MIHAVGPDIYVLNKSIGDHRTLFEVKRVEGGLNNAVPLFDPDDTEFSVNDVIADTAANWIEKQWQMVGTQQSNFPVRIFCDGDYGETLPRQIQG